MRDGLFVIRWNMAATTEFEYKQKYNYYGCHNFQINYLLEALTDLFYGSDEWNRIYNGARDN